MTSPPDSHNKRETEDIDWRSGLLNRIGVVVVALFTSVGVALLTIFRSQPANVFGIFLLGASPILAGALVATRIPYIAKATFIIAAQAIATISAYLLIAYMPGSALSAALSLIAAALLIGRRAFVALLVLYAVVLLSMTYSLDQGLWAGPNPIDANIGDPVNWYRTTLVSVLLWAGLGFSVIFVVNALELNLARRRAALEDLEREVAERQAAEAARREAEAVASQAQKMEAVGQLAAGIAHDFNNALVVIQGWNELRGDFDTDDKQRHGTEMIRQAAEHTAQLSHRLLTFARKDTREPKHLYLDQLVHQAGDSLEHLVGRRIKLRFDVRAGAVVHVDESQIQQLLFNLVLNARDALAREGSITIIVRDAVAAEVERLELEVDSWVVLEVTDDGPGIDAETLQHIFEPFFTTKARGEGTGLGLSTAASIATQSSGIIDVKSRPGCTTFSVYLPCSDAESVAVPEERIATDTSVLGLRTLVLEDNDLVRQAIVSALQNSGNTVLECATGDEALTLLEGESEPFDLLCSDAIFPGSQFGDVLAGLEKHSPAAKVLICSGYIPEQLAISELESDEYAFLAKPFTGSQLMESIRELIR